MGFYAVVLTTRGEIVEPRAFSACRQRGEGVWHGRKGKYPGLRKVIAKKGETVYRISYVHPQRGRIRKTLEGITEARAAQIRAMDIADALRGDMTRKYQIETKPAAPCFEVTGKDFLRWAKEDLKKVIRWKFQGRLSGRQNMKLRRVGDVDADIIEKITRRNCDETPNASVSHAGTWTKRISRRTWITVRHANSNRLTL
jgi:hypothetical protein